MRTLKGTIALIGLYLLLTGDAHLKAPCRCTESGSRALSTWNGTVRRSARAYELVH